MIDTDITQAGTSPLHTGFESAKWQSTELVHPHASGMESLHSMNGLEEALRPTAEVSPSDWYESCCDGARMSLDASLLSQVPRVDSQ